MRMLRSTHGTSIPGSLCSSAPLPPAGPQKKGGGDARISTNLLYHAVYHDLQCQYKNTPYVVSTQHAVLQPSTSSVHK
eukprot:3731430-Rhodomonas_salina.2